MQELLWNNVEIWKWFLKVEQVDPEMVNLKNIVGTGIKQVSSNFDDNLSDIFGIKNVSNLRFY